MPIQASGWELHIERRLEQRNPKTGRRRTVGRYQVYHDGVPQMGNGLSGTSVESKGPGANRPQGNGLRIEEGRYPLATQNGSDYVTYGYKDSQSPTARPRPGLELLQTGQRTEILVHPGQNFLASVGCINLCTQLTSYDVAIDYAPSRTRVIAVIDDLKTFLGGRFPPRNGLPIPNAFVVIDGEPPSA